MIVLTLQDDNSEIIGRLNIINQDVYNRTGIDNYSYEFCDPRNIPQRLRLKGKIARHSRQQSIWVLAAKVLQNIDPSSCRNSTAKTEKNPAPQYLKAELWPMGEEEGIIEIGKIEFNPQANNMLAYKICDPDTSPFALQGAGEVKSEHNSTSAWFSVQLMVLDMQRQGIIPIIEKKEPARIKAPNLVSRLLHACQHRSG